MIENHFAELLESEGGLALLEAGENRGWILPVELEAFAVAHELSETEIEGLIGAIDRAGFEIREALRSERQSVTSDGIATTADHAPDPIPATMPVFSRG